MGEREGAGRGERKWSEIKEGEDGGGKREREGSGRGGRVREDEQLSGRREGREVSRRGGMEGQRGV